MSVQFSSVASYPTVSAIVACRVIIIKSDGKKSGAKAKAIGGLVYTQCSVSRVGNTSIKTNFLYMQLLL